MKTLSPEQESEIAKLPQWWIANASRPLDRDDKAREAIAALYGLCNLKTPEIVFCDSPMSAIDSLRDSMLDSLRNSLWNPVWDSLWDSLWDSVRDSVRDSMRDAPWFSVRDSVRDSLWYSLLDSVRDSLRSSLRDSMWDALLDSLLLSHEAAFFQAAAIAGVQFDREKYDKFQLICQELFWVFPCRDICYVVDKPRFIGWQDGVIHASDRAAVEFADGFKVWAIEGVLVDEQIVVSPESQTIEQIRNEGNEEVRRIRIERFSSKAPWQQRSSKLHRTQSVFSFCG